MPLSSEKLSNQIMRMADIIKITLIRFDSVEISDS